MVNEPPSEQGPGQPPDLERSCMEGLAGGMRVGWGVQGAAPPPRRLRRRKVDSGSRCRPRARLMPRRTREPRPRPPRPALSPAWLRCHARGATRLGRAPGNNEPLDARTGSGEVRDLNLPRHDLSPCGQRQPRPPPHSVNRPGLAQACPLLKFTPRPPGALPPDSQPLL